MAFWLPLLAGAALGAAKTQFIDKPAADKRREYEARTAELSPWTGLQAQYVQDPSVLGGAMKGGMMGLQMGQAYNMANMGKGAQAAASMAGGGGQMLDPSAGGNMPMKSPQMAMQNPMGGGAGVNGMPMEYTQRNPMGQGQWGQMNQGFKANPFF